MEEGNTDTTQRKSLIFYITISYLASLITIRILVLIADSANTQFARMALQGKGPSVQFNFGRNIILFGHHIHHFYFGLILIIFAGLLAIVGTSSIRRKHLAVMYGVGLGLFMDEIGLLLTWGDYYSSVTYILSLVIVSIFLNIVFFPYFWRNAKTNLFSPENSNSFVWNTLINYKSFLKVADIVSEKTNQTERTSLVFTGLAYLVVGALILFFPKFVYYWVAGIFIIQGVSSLINAWQKGRE